MKLFLCFATQVINEQIQDWRVGGIRPRAEQNRIRGAVEQRPAPGAEQVRSRLVPPIFLT